MLAGILAAQPLTGKGLAEHDIMIAGDSAAGTAIAELLAEAIARQSRRWPGTPLNLQKSLFFLRPCTVVAP